ncbi:hypothetical protein [Sphingomonas cavernae]|uniref:Uncharacterized protein n=1 Tax=Sphingomonas cavernae TaxID=2320861 RepID=A0A418WJQ7_9SPHN|nr:hypothetical protein [Sphingomonas cavernae]RJF90277.1 hypothetical protein D3876_08375 [Sphingomonas cavernae]
MSLEELERICRRGVDTNSPAQLSANQCYDVLTALEQLSRKLVNEGDEGKVDRGARALLDALYPGRRWENQADYLQKALKTHVRAVFQAVTASD